MGWFNHCWKCGKELKSGEKVLFNDWDAYCHVDCCPVLTEGKELMPECYGCVIYQTKKKDKPS